FRCVVAGGLRIKAWTMIDAAALGIGRAVIKPPYAGEGNCSGAHGAWFERDMEIAFGQALGLEQFAGLPDNEYFGMRGDIIVLAGAVACAGDNIAPMHDHGTDRH